MSIDSSRVKDAALRAAQYAFKQSGSECFDPKAKDILSEVIAFAIEAAFDELIEMQVDEDRTRMS